MTFDKAIKIFMNEVNYDNSPFQSEKIPLSPPSDKFNDVQNGIGDIELRKVDWQGNMSQTGNTIIHWKSPTESVKVAWMEKTTEWPHEKRMWNNEYSQDVLDLAYEMLTYDDSPSIDNFGDSDPMGDYRQEN